jgi:hypothetical protein
MALSLAMDYKRIYSNFQIIKDGEQINHTLESVEAITNIRFSYTHGVIIIDESGLNYSSRMSLSRDNRALTEILYLV